MTTYCPRCGNRSSGYAVGLPSFTLWLTCEDCTFVWRSSLRDTIMGLLRNFGGAESITLPAAPLTELPVPADSDRVSPDRKDESSSSDLVEQWLADQGDGPVQPLASKVDTSGDSDVESFLGNDLAAQSAPPSKELPSEALLASEGPSRLIH